MSDMPAGDHGPGADGPIPVPLEPNSAVPETPAPNTQRRKPPLTAAAKRPKSKPLKTPLALFAVGLVLLIIGLALYPRRSLDPAPATTQLFVASSCPLFGIIYAVGSVEDNPGESQITVRLLLPPKSLSGGKKCVGKPDAGLSVEPPPGTKLLNCSRCSDHTSVGLDFLPGREEADYSFFVKASSFGVASNGLSASVALPQINYIGQGTPELFALNRVPSVSSYDWSDPPAVINKSQSAITWDEPMAIGDTPGRVEVGTSEAAQASDNTKLFVAGSLIALAGSAILSAITEAVHTRD